MFNNTYRETTGCYGDVNVESYPQHVDDSEKVAPSSGPAWNMHPTGPAPAHAAHAAHHGNHPGHSSHSPAPTHYHSAFHHHAANPAVDSYGYSLAQAPHKENDPIAGKDVLRSSPPPNAVATAAWQTNRSRSRYPSTVASGAFLPYPAQLNHYDGPPLETGPHGMGHGPMLNRKQSWPGENPYAGLPPGGQYQRDPSIAIYGENIRGNVSGGIIRHTTNVSGMEARNGPSQQHQAMPQHLQHQQQSLLHHQQQHSVPHHQLLCQLVQKEREAQRLPGYQDRHSVVRSRISGYPEPLFPQHQHPQYCSAQESLRKGPLPVSVDSDRRSAFTSRQTSGYAHGPSNWNKSAVPFIPSFHTPPMLAPHRGGGSAFQPCNKVGEHEMYPESLIWSKTGQVEHGGHIQGPWMQDPQSQFLSRQMNKQSLMNNGNVLGLDTGQMGVHAVMQSSGGRPPVNIPKGTAGPMGFQQQHIHLQNPHIRSQMMHLPQAPAQLALQQPAMMQQHQHQSSPLSNSQHSPMVASPQDMQSPQMANPCSQQPSQQQADTQLICNEGDGKESQGNSRSLRNCLDVRQFLAEWDEDTDVGTPRPCVDESEGREIGDQALDTTEEALVVLDCRSLRREEAANLLTMYSVPEAEGLLACQEGMFNAASDTVAQSALQNLLDSVTSSGSNSTTIATPLTSPTGQTRSLDMLLNAALPTPPASQEHNIAQTNLPLSTPVAVVGLGSPMSPHLGDTIRQPKMDETGFGVLSPTSPAASVKFTCATVNTPFVKFPSADDPPSVIQSSRDHLSFDADNLFSSDKRSADIMSPSACKSVEQPPASMPLLSVDTAQPSAVEADIIPSPAPSDASTDNRMTTSLRAFRKQRPHSPDHISEAPDSFDSHSHDTSDIHPRSSRTSSLIESDDAVDRSQWAFAQITKTSRTPTREDFTATNNNSIIKTTKDWVETDAMQDVQNFKQKLSNNSDQSMVDKGTAPLNCALETQKSDSSKFDKSTSPTIFLTNKNTQTEDSQQNIKRMESFNDTFAQTSVRSLQDEIHNEAFSAGSLPCLQDEIHQDTYAQASLLSLHEEIENYTAQETLRHVTNERLPLSQTELSRVESFSKETKLSAEFSSEKTQTEAMSRTTEGVQLPSSNKSIAQDLHRAGAEVLSSNKYNAGCSTSEFMVTDVDRSQEPSKISVNEVHLGEGDCRLDRSSFSPPKSVSANCSKVNSLESTVLNTQVETLKTNEVAASAEISRLDICSAKISKVAPSAQESRARESESEERNRSVATGTDDELCPQYLSRIVDISPGNIPKILLSRLKEKSSKKNGVIKRLPSIRLTRVCSPMSSSGSDPEYVCSVSDTEPGTPSKHDTNTLDSVFSDHASNDHKKTSTSHRKNKRAKHCDVEVQSSPLSLSAVHPSENIETVSERCNSLDKNDFNPPIDVPMENDITTTDRNSHHMSTTNFEDASPEIISASCSHNERSIEVQTEEHKSSGDNIKISAGDTAVSVPQTEDLNDILGNTETVPTGLSAITSQEIISAKHQETETQTVLPSLDLEELPPIENEIVKSPIIETECQPASSRSSFQTATFTPNLGQIEPETLPDIAIALETCNNNKAFNDLEKENVFEEKDLAIDLSVQKVENRKSGTEDDFNLPTLVSSPINVAVMEESNLAASFPVPGGMSPGDRRRDAEKVVSPKSGNGSACQGTTSFKTVVHQQGEEIVNEEGEKSVPCEETLRQSEDTLGINQEESKTPLNLPDHCEEVSSKSLEAPETVSLSKETPSPGEPCNVMEENVFLSPRNLNHRSSIDICENDIGHSTVSQKASSHEFFETENCGLQVKGNIPTVETNIEINLAVDNSVEKSCTGPLVEVASSQPNCLPQSSERSDPVPIGDETRGTSQHAALHSESKQIESPTNCGLEKTTFSEPVAYSDLFGANSNDTKCDMSDVVVTNPFVREETTPCAPESCSDNNLHKDSRTTVECCDINSSAGCFESPTKVLVATSGGSSEKNGCLENHNADAPSCSSQSHFERGIQKECDRHPSDGDTPCSPIANLCKEDEASPQIDTCDLENHIEDAVAAPSKLPSDSISSLVEEEDNNFENGGNGSQNCIISDADSLCNNQTQGERESDNLECPNKEATIEHPAEPEKVVHSSTDQEDAMVCSMFIKQECPDSPNDQSESHSSQENQVEEGLVLSDNYVICLSDIPLPSEECYKKYLAKQNLLRQPAPVSYKTSERVGSSVDSYHFGVQVEESEGVITADKDTQSGDDNFTLSDEEKAFPDPLAPNFDVARIPLPDECVAIKNRILKSRNRKRPRQQCDNECCTSKSPRYSDVNSPGTSVGIQCTKPREAKNLFSLRSKASQTHKIQIKLKPRYPSSSSAHSNDSQTLMEVVEEVKKVLHDGDGDCIKQESEKEGVSTMLYPEDRPQACEYVIEPYRSKFCDNPHVEEVLSIEAGQTDDCDFFKVSCREVFPVNDSNGSRARIGEMKATSPTDVFQEGSSPLHATKDTIDQSEILDGKNIQESTYVTSPHQAGSDSSFDINPSLESSPSASFSSQCATHETIASHCAETVARDLHQDSTDNLTSPDLTVSSTNIQEIQKPCATRSVDLNLSERELSVCESSEVTEQCSVPNELFPCLPSNSTSFSKEKEKTCKSPILDKNIIEFHKPNDEDCPETNFLSSRAENEGEISSLEQKTDMLSNTDGELHTPSCGSSDLTLSLTEAKSVDLRAEDSHEKCQDFSKSEDSALLNDTEGALSKENNCVPPQLLSKSFYSEDKNCNKSSESDKSISTSNLVVSNTDLEKTELFENKFECNSDAKRFLEEEEQFICDKHERENVPCGSEDKTITADFEGDLFLCSENKKEETTLWENADNSCLKNDGDNVLFTTKEEAISTIDTREDNSFSINQENFPSNLGEKVSDTSSTCAIPNECQVDSTPEPSIYSGDVLMAIGKRVYKLSTEWQTVHLGEDDEQTETEISNVAPSDTPSLSEIPAEEVSLKSPESQCHLNDKLVECSTLDTSIEDAVPTLVADEETVMKDSFEHDLPLLDAPGQVVDEEAAFQDSIEDDLPPLDAPGLEAANSADSDSDREMPCLQPEPPGQITAGSLHITRRENSSHPFPCSQSTEDKVSSELQPAIEALKVSSPNAAEERDRTASKASPVFSTARTFFTTAPRKDMPAKRPHDSDDSEDSGSDDSSSNDTDGRSRREKQPRGEASEDAPEAERAPSLTAEEPALLEVGVEGVVKPAEDLLSVSEAGEGAPLAAVEEGAAEAVQEQVPEDVAEVVSEVGVDCIEISDIRTDPTDWSQDAADLAAADEATWRCVEVISTEESVREEVVETATADDDGEEAVDLDEVGDPRDPRPRLKCSLSWDRVLLAGEAFVVGPAKVGLRLEQAAEESPASPWNVVDSNEENNNHLPKSPPLSPVFKVSKLILKRPGPASPGATGSACSSTPDRSPVAGADAAHSLKTKGALKSYHSDDAVSRWRGEVHRGGHRDPHREPHREAREERERGRHRHRHDKPRWYSHLSPASSTPSRSPGAASTAADAGEVPRVIIKRQCSPKRPAVQTDAGPDMLKSLVVVLERDPLIDAMAMRAAAKAAARLRRLKRSKEVDGEPGRSRASSHGHSRGSAVRGSSEPRGRRGAHSPPPRKRARSMREHDLHDHHRAEGAEGGKMKRRKKSSSGHGHDDDRRGRHRQRSRDKDRKSYSAKAADNAAREHIDELVKQWQMTPSGKDTPMPMPSPGLAPLPGSPQYDWHQVAASYPTDALAHAYPSCELAEAAAQPEAAEAAAQPSQWFEPERQDEPSTFTTLSQTELVLPAFEVAVEAAVEDAVEAAVEDTVVDTVDEAVEEAVERAVEDAAQVAVDEAVAVEVAVEAAAEVAIDDAAEDYIEDAAKDYAEDAPEAEAKAADLDVYQCEACGQELSAEPSPARADHIKQHPYHCQRCHQAFASQVAFTQHLKAAHPNTQELHHCLLCHQTFPDASQHAIHMKSPSHCYMERSQRNTIHTLFRMFTGSNCPRLSPLTPEDMHALDWPPKDSGVIHFYHQATPLQLAMEDWHLHHANASSQSAKEDTPNPE